MGVLDREIATYRNCLPALLEHASAYVLIKGATVVGLFPTRNEALEAGYARFLDEAFLVRQIRPEEPIHATTRPLAPG